jgi:GNAT superfamily N-acetyltransferase
MIKSDAPAPGVAVKGFTLRAAAPDDADSVAALYAAACAAPAGEAALPGAPSTPAAFGVMIQTGSAFLLAERETALAGALRHWDEDGIGWFDLLAARRTGAGPALIRGAEMSAQDRGLRLVRARIPDDARLPDAFLRWGYLPVSRGPAAAGGPPTLVVEKRLPLLTVREQRRGDAAAIGEITGDDPWVYEQGARPGVFVASDGERVVGFISVRDGGGGLAQVTTPVLLGSYRGRGIAVWMVERAAGYAETNGYHTAELAITPATEPLRRALEDRLWQHEPPAYIKRFRNPTPPEDDW